MDGINTPPPIPSRTRQHARRRSLQGPSTPSSNRVHIQPASPEIISSLISSLSIISAPANQLFEHPSGSQSTPSSPAPTTTVFGSLNPHMSNGVKSSEGSFGLDYGAYKRVPLTDLQEDESLDELAASPPVIRTAKPPSGFSPLTAPPKSPARDGHIKSFIRGTSRPSSKGSGTSKDQDDASSIGNVSIEPGLPPTTELRRKSSSDSWGKKQARNQRGLMYMSSKERLRERELERKRTSSATVGSAKGDRPHPLHFDADSFMAGTAIGEEPEETPSPKDAIAAPSPSIGGTSPGLATSSPGGIGSGRYIPARDSSLRKSTPSTSKRSSQRLSRHSGKQRDSEYVDDPTQMLHLRTPEHSRERGRRDHHVSSNDHRSKMLDPLDNLEMPRQTTATNAASKPGTDRAKREHLQVVEDTEDSAPSPAVAQRKARPSPDRADSPFGQRRKLAKSIPEPIDTTPQAKRSGSKLKRLSAPLSPRSAEADRHQRSSSSPLLRAGTPEPSKSPQIHVDDRPSSADSIDDAVDAYLSSPRLSQRIRHPQTGRLISFSEVGDPEGFAVFCCVGMGLTRYIMAFYDELALTLKLRLITPDRPGVGDSAPYADGTSTPLSWPDDVYTICQTLKINKFSIMAHSAGAIYALATALRMPQHIRGRIHLLAPWIPPSQMNVIGGQAASPPSNALPTSQRILRALPTPILKAANSSFMSATSSSITSSLPKNQKRSKRKSTGRDTPSLAGRSTFSPAMDKQNHGRDSPANADSSKPGALERAANTKSDPNSEAAVVAAATSSLLQKERQMTYDARLTQAIWDLATSGANPAVDLLVCLERRHTIGFRYVDITRAVVIHHGSKDTRVPVENVRWLGKTMRRCEVRVLEGEGHGLMASAAVMGGVLMEIAREWEDWAKVTGIGKDDTGKRTVLRERASVGAFR